MNGDVKLLHGGFGYVVDKSKTGTRSASDISFWTCERRRTCTASLSTDKKVLRTLPTQHNHQPFPPSKNYRLVYIRVGFICFVDFKTMALGGQMMYGLIACLERQNLP